MADMENRLEQQIRFLVEIDKLKAVLRRSRLIHADRLENSAEHSWHAATAAMLLSEHAAEPVDLLRVVRMLLAHDLVEIDAGDTFCYDVEASMDQGKREAAAAARIFSLLPEEQGIELRALWEEFEAGESPEARFAAAADHLMPLLHSFYTRGSTWKEHGVTAPQVISRNACIEAGSEELWRFVRSLIDVSVRRGYLRAEPQDPTAPAAT
jgi:putative hydrolase of HD superfamily